MIYRRYPEQKMATVSPSISKKLSLLFHSGETQYKSS